MSGHFRAASVPSSGVIEIPRSLELMALGFVDRRSGLGLKYKGQFPNDLLPGAAVLRGFEEGCTVI